MSTRRITVDRIALTLDGLPIDEAQVLAARLEAALAAQLNEACDVDRDTLGADAEMSTSLTGPALLTAVTARLADMIIAIPEPAPWP